MILFGKLLCYLFLEENILYGKIVSEYMFVFFNSIYYNIIEMSVYVTNNNIHYHSKVWGLIKFFK